MLAGGFLPFGLSEAVSNQAFPKCIDRDFARKLYIARRQIAGLKVANFVLLAAFDDLLKALIHQVNGFLERRNERDQIRIPLSRSIVPMLTQSFEQQVTASSSRGIALGRCCNGLRMLGHSMDERSDHLCSFPESVSLTDEPVRIVPGNFSPKSDDMPTKDDSP